MFQNFLAVPKLVKKFFETFNVVFHFSLLFGVKNPSECHTRNFYFQKTRLCH